MIDFLNSPSGAGVSRIGVTFTPAFKTAISNVTLSNGVKATTIIRDWAGHSTHFHFDLVATLNAGRLKSEDFWKQWNRPTSIVSSLDKTNSVLLNKNVTKESIKDIVIIYPNPARSHLTISGTLKDTRYEAELQVMTLEGKVVYGKLLPRGGTLQVTLDISSLTGGMYFYKILQQKSIVAKGLFTVAR